VSDEHIIHRVNRLIREFKEQAGADGMSPDDVCRHIASALSVSEAAAKALILEAGLRGANPSTSLDEEHAALTAAGDALEREHIELHHRPDDHQGHAAHRDRLRQHIVALQAHIGRLRAERPPKV
jgi:hypothetical protein